MLVIKGVFIILAFLFLGNATSALTGEIIPGSVFGMLELFLALVFKIVKPSDIRSVADFLTKNMTIFFIPAAIGIMEEWELISLNFWGWIAVTVISTVMVLLSAGYIQQLLQNLKK